MAKVSEEQPPAKPQTPEERAHSLLLRHLTPNQQLSLKNHGYFQFSGSNGGKYRLYTVAQLREWRLSEGHTLLPLTKAAGTDFFYGRMLYTHTPGLTSVLNEWDTMLAIKIAVEADEFVVLRACPAHFPEERIKRHKEDQ